MILVRRPTFTCVRTFWLIPKNIQFTCFCFTYCSSTPDLYSQFAYLKGRGAIVYFSRFYTYQQTPLKLKIFQKGVALPFYKKEINRLRTLLLLFIEICIQKRCFALIQSETPTTKVTNLTIVLTKNVSGKLRYLQTFVQSLPKQ